MNIKESFQYLQKKGTKAYWSIFIYLSVGLRNKYNPDRKSINVNYAPLCKEHIAITVSIESAKPAVYDSSPFGRGPMG